jgi:hypothetical protein
LPVASGNAAGDSVSTPPCVLNVAVGVGFDDHVPRRGVAVIAVDGATVPAPARALDGAAEGEPGDAGAPEAGPGVALPVTDAVGVGVGLGFVEN